MKVSAKKPAQPTKRRCWCEINLSDLEHNLKFARRKVGSDRAIWCSVKANAYGHGLVRVAQFLEENKLCNGLLCAHWKEADELRRAKIKLPILLLSDFLKEELETIFKLNAAVTLSSVHELKMVEREARRSGVVARVHLKLDTGMTRLGAYAEEFRAMILQALRSRWIRVEGVYTHFANADSNASFTRVQWGKFKNELPRHIASHACNSSGLLAAPYAYADAVRIGIAAYGISPDPSYQQLLRPILSWKTRIVFVKEIPKNTPISYGSTYATKRKTRLATLGVGYGDGLLRALSNRGCVLIDGKRCPILGNVTMDQIMVDVTDLPKAAAAKGTEAVLIGTQKKGSISAQKMADWANTIPYEILTLINGRVDRVYVDSSRKKNA